MRQLYEKKGSAIAVKCLFFFFALIHKMYLIVWIIFLLFCCYFHLNTRIRNCHLILENEKFFIKFFSRISHTTFENQFHTLWSIENDDDHLHYWDVNNRSWNSSLRSTFSQLLFFYSSSFSLFDILWHITFVRHENYYCTEHMKEENIFQVKWHIPSCSSHIQW